MKKISNSTCGKGRSCAVEITLPYSLPKGKRITDNTPFPKAATN